MQQLGYESGRYPVNSSDTEIASDASGFTMEAIVECSSDAGASVWTDNGDGMNGFNARAFADFELAKQIKQQKTDGCRHRGQPSAR